ncbi:MAG: hypothetical protein SVV03_02960 [Candidatus Nanohaloarchaea archaeon]|nr:hypothetical protein [Candidatus Nanohaloarchaea archaeon]
MKKSYLLALLVLAMVLAGCTGRTQVGSKPTKSQGEGLEIQGPKCSSATSDDCSNLLDFEEIVVELTAINRGGQPVTLPFKKPFGETEDPELRAFNHLSASALQSGCTSLFSMQESSLVVEKIDEKGIASTYEKPRGASSGETTQPQSEQDFFDNGRNVVLEEGEKLDFEWTFRVKDQEIPSPGFSCSLSLSIDTEQSVTAFREMQIKGSRDVAAPDQQLEATSTASPMVLKLDGPSSRIQDEGAFPVQVFMQNQGSGQPSDIQLETTEPSAGDLLSCSLQQAVENPNQLEFRKDEGETERRIFECSAEGIGDEVSRIATLSMTANFNYEYDIEDIEVGVSPLEK